jgi:hypothetical protein
MARSLGLIVVAVSSAVLSGCAGTTLLVNRHQGSPPPATSTTAISTSPATTGAAPTSAAALAYLAALSREQAELAAAERRIPRRARTPAALARSIRLLERAIVRLGGGLQAIVPPAPVAAQHARLVSIVRTFAAQLGTAARVAVRPGGELRAGNMLVGATVAASSAFSSTASQINAALRH